MYIWGGGWNEEDTAAGIEATTLGLSPNWAAFAGKQNAGYNYKNHRYRIHDGLDCSGYVGWAVYNTLETENGRPGYVYKSTDMPQKMAARGYRQYERSCLDRPGPMCRRQRPAAPFQPTRCHVLRYPAAGWFGK